MVNAIVINDYTYLIEEKWKPLIFKGVHTKYEVSNTGKVRNKKTGKLLSEYTDKDGYKHITITVNKKLYHRGVHRYVATAFIKNPKNKPEVNHINGHKDDNVYLNLEWVTTAENVKHAFDTGLKHARLGSANSLSKYSDKQIRKACKLLSKGVSNKLISQKTGINYKYITDIKYGRRWHHISNRYDLHPK